MNQGQNQGKILEEGIRMEIVRKLNEKYNVSLSLVWYDHVYVDYGGHIESYYYTYADPSKKFAVDMSILVYEDRYEVFYEAHQKGKTLERQKFTVPRGGES